MLFIIILDVHFGDGPEGCRRKSQNIETSQSIVSQFALQIN